METLPDFKRWATMRIRTLLNDYRSAMRATRSAGERRMYAAWVEAMEKELDRRETFSGR